MKYINVPKLKRLFFKCYKILPATYDESLSYYEQLCKVTYSLNEAITGINNLNDNVDELNERCNVFQDEIEEIANTVNTFVEETEEKIDNIIDNKLNDFEKRFDELTEKTQKEIKELQNEMSTFINKTFPNLISELTKTINDELNEINNKFENLSLSLQTYIKTELQKIIDSIPEITSVMVISPVTGKLVEIQTALYQMFYFIFKDKLLNCGELDNLKLTCYKIDNYEVNGKLRGLTALEWDTNTKSIFKWVDDKDKVRSYETGEKVLLDVNVDFNNKLLRNSGCFTCSEFDNERMDCNFIDGKLFTVFQIDWKSNSLTL